MARKTNKGSVEFGDVVISHLADLQKAGSAADFQDLLTQWQDVFVTELIVNVTEYGITDKFVKGGKGFDFVSFVESETGVVTSLSGSIPKPLLPHIEQSAIVDVKYASVEGLIGSDHNDVLIGKQKSNVIFGGGGDDWLIGDAGPKGKGDLLIGGDGDDVLFGGSGGDILIGGAGGDSFILTIPTNAINSPTDAMSGMPLIVDFGAGDHIGFKAGADVSSVGSAVDGVIEFQDGDDGLILYNTNNGWLSYDADADGPGNAVHFATLLSNPLGVFPILTADSFIGTSTEGTGI